MTEAQQQAYDAIQALKDELKERASMSGEEARNTVLKDLQDVGILDEDGNVVEAYKGMLVRGE